MLNILSGRDRLATLNWAAAVTVLVLAVALCAWIVGRTIWFFVVTPPNREHGATSGDGVRGNDPAIATNRVDLAELHLFGRPGGVLAAPVASVATETQLDLVLLGTLAGENPKSGLAIIADQQTENTYRIGDALPGDAQLYEIYTDRVILTRRGRYESLSLRAEADAPPRSPSRNTSTAANNPRAGQQNIDWQAIQEQTRLDPIQLAQQIRAMPFTENGKQIGVRLQAGRDATLMRKLGLRNSDIVTAVNGIPLDNPTRQLELIRQLQSQSRFAVIVRRDGRELTLNIDLSDLRNL